jgi:hypothetical protein
MVVAVGSPAVCDEAYKQILEEYTEALKLIRQEFAELEKQEHSRYLRQAHVQAKYFRQTIEIGLAELKAKKDRPPTKTD